MQWGCCLLLCIGLVGKPYPWNVLNISSSLVVLFTVVVYSIYNFKVKNQLRSTWAEYSELL